MILSSRRLGSVVFSVMMAAASTASASSSGKTSNGFSATQGCNQTNCHGGGQAPQVAMTGPSTLQAGEQGTFTLTITSSAQDYGGLDVAASVGQFAVGGPDSTATKVAKGTGGRNEIVHKSKKAAVKGVVTFTFLWTAPTDAAPGASVELTGWGNAVDGNGKDSGDLAVKATHSVAIAQASGEGGAAGSGGSGQSGTGTAGSGAGGSGTAGSGTAGSGAAGKSAAGASAAGSDGDAGTAGQPDEGGAGDSGAAGSDGETSGATGTGVSGSSGQTASGGSDGGCQTSGGPGGAVGAVAVAAAMLASMRRRG